MAGTKLRLGRPDVAAVIDQKHAAERDGWRKTRLLAVKLAARGEHTSAEVADICGIARGHLFRWLAAVLRLVGRGWMLDQVNGSSKTAGSH